jgi:hypothetical protein
MSQKRVYLPLVLLFWLFGSLGSFVLGQELRFMPQALSGLSSDLSQALGSLFTGVGFGTQALAAPWEKGLGTPTTPPTPPNVHILTTVFRPNTTTPTAPPKANQGHGEDDKHGGGPHKRPKGGKDDGGKSNGPSGGPDPSDD